MSKCIHWNNKKKYYRIPSAEIFTDKTQTGIQTGILEKPQNSIFSKKLRNVFQNVVC